MFGWSVKWATYTSALVISCSANNFYSKCHVSYIYYSLSDIFSRNNVRYKFQLSYTYYSSSEMFVWSLTWATYAAAWGICSRNNVCVRSHVSYICYSLRDMGYVQGTRNNVRVKSHVGYIRYRLRNMLKEQCSCEVSHELHMLQPEGYVQGTMFTWSFKWATCTRMAYVPTAQ